MGHTLAVGRRQRVGHLHGQVEKLLRRQPVREDQSGKRLAAHELHGDEVDAVDLFDRIDRDDVRVRDGRQRQGLALEAPQTLDVFGHFRRQDLEGDVAPQSRVSGEVNLPHAARADQGSDLIWSQPRGRTDSHVRKDP